MILIQTVYFFFDDSGVFHRNEKSGRFVYGGYVFLSRSELDAAKRKYINANKKLKVALNETGELKAANLSNKHRRSLFNSVAGYHCVSCVVDLSRIYASILNDKKSICRYKDYLLKRCVKAKLQELIRLGHINPNEDIRISIYIDEQLTASNGYYSLRDSIVEELQHGIENFNYGVFHKSIFNKQVFVSLEYCESKNNYLIQASDILANRIWSSYRTNKRDLRTNIPQHLHLTFP